MDIKLAPHLLRKLLTPAVRLALRYGIQLNEIIEVLKSAMVESAQQSLTSSGEAVSASRISAMTGVHRKDIARLSAPSKSGPAPVSLISRVMAQWQHGARFVTKSGKPRTLGCEGRDSEFSQLVASVNGGDLSGYAVLFEMERRGIVTRRNGTVRLAWRDYAPSDNLKEQLEQWGDDSIDLGQAVEENLFDQSSVKHHHLKTSFDSIPESDLPRIREWVMREGSLFHQKVRRFLAMFDQDISPQRSKDAPRVRVAVGSFSICSSPQKKEKPCSV